VIPKGSIAPVTGIAVNEVHIIPPRRAATASQHQREGWPGPASAIQADRRDAPFPTGRTRAGPSNHSAARKKKT